MKIELSKDKDGYEAKVSGRKDLFAFGYTKREALQELGDVVASELESNQEIRKIEKKIDELLRKLEDAE